MNRIEPLPEADSSPSSRETLEVEGSLLGCILDAPKLVWPMIENAHLDAESFSDLRHRKVFVTIREMLAEAKQIDLITVSNKLRADLSLDEIGGLHFLQSLDALVPGNGESFAPGFIEILADKRAVQQIKDTALQMLDAVDHPDISRELIINGAAQSLREISLRGGGKAKITFVDAAGFCANPPTEPPKIVYGLLHRGSKLVLGGGSKSYKTWTLLDLAVSVSQGEPWLSCKTVKSRVLYVNLEIQDAFFSQRINQVCHAKNLKLQTDTLTLCNLRGHNSTYCTMLPEIERAAKEHGFGLIVLDPIYKMLGDLDENKAGDIGRLMSGLETLAQTTGAAIAFGAHFSKGNQAGKESIDRISGSGVFARDPDTILTFTRHETEGAFVVESTLRNFRPIDPFVVRWDCPVFRRDDELDPTQLKQAKNGRTPTHSEEDILNVLGSKRMTTKEWQEAAQEEGISKTTFYRLFKTAKSTLKQEENQWRFHKSHKPI